MTDQQGEMNTRKGKKTRIMGEMVYNCR